MFKVLFCLASFAFAFGLLGTATTAEAKIFRNAYVSFELPESWKCVLEHTEWVCRSEIDKESKEAIIILTAKEVGPTDSFESYVSHLNTVQSTSTKIGGVPSKVIYAPKRVQINDQPWVDGLHLASEIPNYFTRYLATIKDKVAVLVTFSAHKDHYTKYSQDFFKAVMSLRVIAAKNLLGSAGGPIRPGGETLGAPISSSMPADMAGAEPPPTTGQGGGSSKTKMLFFAIALLLAAGALFVLFKVKKK
jgi:hypothetical protein